MLCHLCHERYVTYCFFLVSGRPELNIKPWEVLRREIKEGNAMVNWTDRAPYAYWKGNPTVGAERRDLLRCNVSGNRDWNARIYAQVHVLNSADLHEPNRT
jgi:hypothetical protein